jgi:hypothetical protein
VYPGWYGKTFQMNLKDELHILVVLVPGETDEVIAKGTEV